MSNEKPETLNELLTNLMAEREPIPMKNLKDFRIFTDCGTIEMELVYRGDAVYTNGGVYRWVK